MEIEMNTMVLADNTGYKGTSNDCYSVQLNGYVQWSTMTGIKASVSNTNNMRCDC